MNDLNDPLTSQGSTYRIIEQLVGEHGTVNHAARKDASPDTFFTKDTAPTLFIQGEQDPLVPAQQSEAASKKLLGLKVASQVVVVEGMGHGISPKPLEQAKALDELSEWFQRDLKHLPSR